MKQQTSLSDGQKLYFRDDLRAARAVALSDAEKFEPLIHAFENLGSLLAKPRANLQEKFEAIGVMVDQASALGVTIPNAFPECHMTLAEMADSVRHARNDAVHTGAFARRLTTHAIELAIVVEEALTITMNEVRQFMVRNPVCAEDWQPLSFVRQSMLANSFSYLPVFIVSGSSNAGEWMLVSDYRLAEYMRAPSSATRNQRMQMILVEARQGGLKLEKPHICSPKSEVALALKECKGLPVLIIEDTHLVGLLTPFDLL